jgi:hypothetical protein
MLTIGYIHKDTRGTIRFVNDFDMSAVVRMYCIEPNLVVVRAWQGHKVERKWFYAAKGRFLVKTVEMDSLNKEVFELTSLESKVLEIGGGYYNGFEALEEGSVLMVFSDFNLEQSKNDDYRETIENIKW